jgi:hypothetical protein
MCNGTMIGVEPFRQPTRPHFPGAAARAHVGVVAAERCSKLTAVARCATHYTRSMRLRAISPRTWTCACDICRVCRGGEPRQQRATRRLHGVARGGGACPERGGKWSHLPTCNETTGHGGCDSARRTPQARRIVGMPAARTSQFDVLLDGSHHCDAQAAGWRASGLHSGRLGIRFAAAPWDGALRTAHALQRSRRGRRLPHYCPCSCSS